MMRIVCLANSFRTGGFCIGGVKLNSKNTPQFSNNRPIWIRPISDLTHREISQNIGRKISLLDIIEFEEIKSTPLNHQVEDYLIKENTIKIVGKFIKGEINSLCDNNNFNLLFGNKGKAVPQETISELKHSLMLIRLNEYEVYDKIYKDKPYPKQRIKLNYNNVEYDFPITDPDFIYNYKSNKNYISNTEILFVTISLTASLDNWYYKLAAGIIL